MTTYAADDHTLELHRLLVKAQTGFDMIVDALEEGDTEMAMLIASRICLGPTYTQKEKVIDVSGL